MPEPHDTAPRGAGSRSSRERTARRRRDRRHQWGIVAVAAVIGIVAGSLGTSRDHSARALAPQSATTTTSVPVKPRAFLIAHVGSNKRIDVLAVAGVRGGGRVGSVVFLPTATLVQVPSFDSQPLSDIAHLGGSGLLGNAVSNALGLHFDRVVVFRDAQLTDLLAPSHRLEVDFGRPVQVDDAAGTLAYTAGRAAISAADATRLVIGPASGGSLEHLVTVQAVLEGWFRRLRDATVAKATAKASILVGPFVTLAHAKLAFDTMPVTTLSSGSTTRYDLKQPDADRLVRSDFPDALLSTAARPRVEILNGTGAVALTQAVARKIVPAGGEITLTGNVPGFGVKHTSIVYYREADLPEARRIAAALGVGSVALGNVALDVIDITVVVGSDFERKRN